MSPINSYEWIAQDESETERLGALLAPLLPPGCVVTLQGTLGAGKTRLVRAIAENLGVPVATVVSPTFVLIHEYQGRIPIYHFDAYRLRDEDEFYELGPDEYFDSQGLSFIEWPEKVANALPVNRLEIVIDLLDNHSRKFTVTGVGAIPKDVVKKLLQHVPPAV